jgi:hypothetical protein
MPCQVVMFNWQGFFFYLLAFSTQNKSHHKSHRDVMTPHHINLYPMVEEKNECNTVEIHPYGENTRGAE